MTSTIRTVTKALAAEEDFLYGEGLAQQIRAGATYTVSKIRGFRPINNSTELVDLDFTKFPKVILVESGTLKFYQHNGTEYEELVIIGKTLTIASAVTSVSAIANRTVIFSVATMHSIANFNNGVKGQELNILSTTVNTTIENNANIVLKGGINYLIPANTGLHLVYTGVVWAEV